LVNPDAALLNKRKDIIPDNLTEHRIHCGYTQTKVAKLLGFTNEVSLSLGARKEYSDLINLITTGHQPGRQNLGANKTCS